MQRDVTARVLVASGDGNLRNAAASALAPARYVVTQAECVDEVIGALRRSHYHLVVLFTLDCLDLLASVVPDRRLGRHHAYIALLPPGSEVPVRWIRWYPQLTLSALVLPLDARALRDAVDLATRALGCAVPLGGR